MFTVLLSLHNILRWFVLVFAILAIVKAIMGWTAKNDWTQADNRAGLLYTIFLDIQVLLGLVLYFFFSPLTTVALRDFGGAMGDNLLRYYAIEHSVVMILAMVVAHIGRSAARKAADSVKKHRRAAIWFTISFILLLAAIPWPFLETGRPWLRLFGITI